MIHTSGLDLRERVRSVFYGWWLVGISGLVMALGNGPAFHGMAAWFPVLERRFGWSRAQLSLAFSMTRVEGSITGPITGYLIEKLGPRRMVLIGLLILGGGFLLLSQVQNLWQFYGAFIVMSSGMGLGTWLPVMTVMNSWFVRRRAMAMALAMEGNALGGILVVPLLAWAINPDQFGPDRWRAAALAIGIITIILALPISRMIRNRPEDYQLLPDGDEGTVLPGRSTTPGTPQPTTAVGLTWQEAIRTRAFWLISFGHASTSMVIVTIAVHIGPMLNLDRGLSLQTVGWVVVTYTGVGAAFTLVAGYLGDRLPIRLTIFVFATIQSASLIVLLLTHSAPLAFLFAVVYGVGFGGRNPLTTAIRGVYFGRRAFASITGISQIPMNFFLFSAPLFAGYMFDRNGNYDVAIYTIAVVSFLGGCLFLPLGEPRQFAPSPRTEQRAKT